MMLETITLQIPTITYQRAFNMADTLKRPLEEMLVEVLDTAIWPLDDVPPEMKAELAAMVYLSNEILKTIANATLSIEQQRRLHGLLNAQGRAELDQLEAKQLKYLMDEYGRTMLRRAQASAILVRREKNVSRYE
ncbi:hypothetical protein QUF63_12310 [Anaerolineales bacterium HSG25]|nr:hypothetical protein [Anaerolineales bacterium HSG25]